MSEDTKTYRVKTVFEIIDKAVKPLNEIEKAAKETAKSTETLKNILLGLGASVVAGRGFSALRDVIVGANNALEQHEMKLAGVTSMYTGVEIEKSWERAERSRNRYMDMSWDSGVEQEELLQTAAELQGPLLQAGASISRIEEITHNAVKAAGAYGIGSQELSGSLLRAITVGARERDQIIRSLLGQKGVEKTISEFNKMDMSERVKTIQKALSGQALQSFVDKQSDETFEGVTGDIKSHLKNLASVAGRPVFEAITKELKTWEVWMVKNRQRLEEIALEVGQNLVKGFHIIKDVFVWMYDHRDALIMVAKAYAAIKIGGLLGGALGEGMLKLTDMSGGNLFKTLTELGTTVDSEGKKVGSAFRSIAAAAGPVMSAFAGGYMIGNYFVEQNKRRKEADARQKEGVDYLVDVLSEDNGPMTGSIDDSFSESTRNNLFRGARNKGLLLRDVQSNQYGVNQELLAASVGRIDEYRMAKLGFGPAYEKSNKEIIAESRLMRYAMSGWKVDLQMAMGSVKGGLAVALLTNVFSKNQDIFDKLAGFQAKPPEQNINITIQQVTAKDPNRWLADMDDMVSRRTRARTRAKRAWKVSPK